MQFVCNGSICGSRVENFVTAPLHECYHARNAWAKPTSRFERAAAGSAADAPISLAAFLSPKYSK